MLPVYNEQDMVGEVIEHLLSEGLDLVVLDNGSTDGSYEVCKKFAEKGLVTLEQYSSSSFNWPLLLRMLYDMALKKNPDWLVRSGQDEFLESGISNVSLKEAIVKEDEKGCNLIQFDVFEFFMTDADNLQAKSTRERFPYYSWQNEDQYRAWKYHPGIRVEDAGGHYPIFPRHIKYKIANRKFVHRHYRYRNKQQAIKNHLDRLNRLKGVPEAKLGWSANWKRIAKEGGPHVVEHKLLTKYLEDNNWNHELKYYPYISGIRPKKNDVFDQDGNLKPEFPTLWEVQVKLKEKDSIITKQQKRSTVVTILGEQEMNKINTENTFLRKELGKIHNSFTWKTLRKFDGFFGKT